MLETLSIQQYRKVTICWWSQSAGKTNQFLSNNLQFSINDTMKHLMKIGKWKLKIMFGILRDYTLESLQATRYSPNS